MGTNYGIISKGIFFSYRCFFDNYNNRIGLL